MRARSLRRGCHRALPWACAAALALTASPARARAVRRLFEPTDLELEDPGLLEVDGQLGIIRGSEAFRLSAPDVEIDLGLPRGFELDLDGALTLEARPDSALAFDHAAADNLWVGIKTGLFAWNDPAAAEAWALGLQIGPKLPLAPDAHGVGIEMLALAGFHHGGTQLMLNAGGLVDPASGDSGRPRGVEGGIDLEQDLIADRWSLTGELGGIYFLSDDPHQLTATVGIAWSPSQMLELSLVALAGVLPGPGNDRYGLLLGLSPKIALWR
jgi:hypothetical protein